jgi:hypothetical protein
MANYALPRRHTHLCLAAALCVMAGLVGSSDAAGQSCPDAGASSQGAYVVPKMATCDPSQYLSNESDAASASDAPGPSMWTGPAQVDASPVAFSGDIYKMLCVQNPNETTFSYDSVKAPYADSAACKLFDNQGHPGPHDCLCGACFSFMQQCDAIAGCRAIAKCAWDSGCTSANGCYLGLTAPCTNVIDQWGTGSVSTGLQAALSSCGQTNQCPAQ